MPPKKRKTPGTGKLPRPAGLNEVVGTCAESDEDEVVRPVVAYYATLQVSDNNDGKGFEGQSKDK
jgi:hypothetical protein